MAKLRDNLSLRVRQYPPQNTQKRTKNVYDLGQTQSTYTTSPTEDTRNTSTVQPGNTLIVAIIQA